MERVLKEMMQSHAKGLYVAIPATVISFDSKTQRGKVSIDILEQIGERYEAIAPLEDVPFAFLRSGGFVITFPINKGDKVQLLFQHRSIDKWLIDGEKDAKDTRSHNVNDAIASNLIAYPLNNTIEKLSEDGISIRNEENSVYILLKEDSIEIKGKTKIEGNVSIDGTLKVTGKIESNVDCVGGGVSLKSHVHGGVLPGSSMTTTPK